MNVINKVRIPLGMLLIVLLGAGLYMVATVPADFQQGNSVKILYVHVSSAKMALLSYLFLTVSAVVYLWKKNETADILVEASAHVGAGFAIVTLCTGSIWGKPMWGAWWAWDARLTSMLMLLLIYVGLIALRGAIEDPVKSAKATAVFGIIGAVDLPIIHFSVTWWRTLHQPASLNPGQSGIKIVGPLLPPLLIMSAAFLVMFLYMVSVKAGAVQAERQIRAIEEEKLHES